jgi:hypothetical protein
MAASFRGLFLFRDPYSTLDQLDSAAEVLVGDLLLLVALISLRILKNIPEHGRNVSRIAYPLLLSRGIEDQTRCLELIRFEPWM